MVGNRFAAGAGGAALTDQWIRDRLFPGRALSEKDLWQRSEENRGPNPEEIASNKRQNLFDLLSVVPGPGNVISAHDAYENGAESVDQFGQGNYGRGALLAAMSGLSGVGAIAGLPIGKLAGAASKDASRTTHLGGIGGNAPTLPVDQASRASRAEAMGYSAEPFYRGEASGKLPSKGDAVFYSRDPEYAGGFAERGGFDAPREFRLNTKNVFSDYEPIKAAQYGKLIEAASKRDPKLAADLAEQIAPGKGVDWVIGFGKARPDFIVGEAGQGAFIRHAIEQGSSDPAGLFKRAGITGLDSGRDVRMLGPRGQRLADAMFDPKKAKSSSLLASMAGGAVLAPAIVDGFTSRRD